MQNKLLYVLLTLVPTTNLFDLFFPISVLGFSFWNTFLVFAVLHLLLFNNKFTKKEFLPILFFSFCYAVLAFLKSFLYEEPFSRIFSNWWYLHMSLIFILIIKKIKPSKLVFSNILLFHVLFLGLIGAFYFFNLPTIEIQSENTKLVFAGIKHRYEGIYSGSNVYSSILVTFFIFFFSISKRALIYWLILPLIVFLGLIASGSRLSLFLFFIFIFYSFYNKNRFVFVIFFSYFIYLILSILPDLQNYRVISKGLEDQSRLDKTVFFLDLIRSNFIEVLTIGVDPVLMSSNNVSISDNSFSLIILNSGFFIFILWLFLMKSISTNLFKSMFKQKFLFVAIILIFSLNNAILYLPWVLFVLFYFNLKTPSRIET
tara:strand:- start:10910 stop:12025 length:1116 start_codon:yes stop_codon:yes gene_type:complete